GLLVLDEPLARRRVYRDFDTLSIGAPSLSADGSEEALARSWLWLSIAYGFGDEAVSLADLLRAKRQGLPYLETAEGWIDLHAPAFRDLERLGERWGNGGEVGSGDDRVRLSLPDLLRLQATTGKPLSVAPDGEGAAILSRLLSGEPEAEYRTPAGLSSRLRPYQESGVRWLQFLWENRLGGLLCDDMGLGKTHQTLALVLSLFERGIHGPYLVVCPTSVISHWRNKIRDHAPGLRAVVHHGAQRRLEGLGARDVLLTSYGVLRRDAGELAAIPLALAVFDEVQHVKNRATLSYRAACELDAQVRLGLTGTPIENAVDDLKTLFDLVLPGYLGSDADFQARYGRAGAGLEDGGDLAELRRLVAPFVLRRLKSTVLHELPEKIEDVRTCALSEEQVRLYRDAVAGRGAELKRQLAAAEGPLPYIHVFALLNLLKQICDHPALAIGDLGRAPELASGKWDLFREILDECLASGQKVVVFTQYLGMIRLMERHLEELGVGFTTLT
ncbi:MAG TPA: SNF2-related protein, partial [Thermoanaerobaculia bacterium]